CFPVRRLLLFVACSILPLPLLVLRVLLVDHVDAPLTPNDLIVGAALLYTGTDLHRIACLLQFFVADSLRTPSAMVRVTYTGRRFYPSTDRRGRARPSRGHPEGSL